MASPHNAGKVTGIRTDHLKKKKSLVRPDEKPAGRSALSEQAEIFDAATASEQGPRPRTYRPATTVSAKAVWPTVAIVLLVAFGALLLVGYRSTEYIGGQAVISGTQESEIVASMRLMLEANNDMATYDEQLKSGDPQQANDARNGYLRIIDQFGSFRPPAALQPGADAVLAHANAGVALADVVEELYLRGLPLEGNIDSALLVALDRTLAEELRLLGLYVERFELDDLVEEIQ